MKRGYFAVGIYHTKTETNVGTLWREAMIFGAAFCFTVGRRYHKQSSDTTKTWRHIPLYHYADMEGLRIPYDCMLVGVEIDKRALGVCTYDHPERAIYLLGAEDHGIPEEILNKCHQVVQLPGEMCHNVSVAGSLIMYDRLAKEPSAPLRCSAF